jgi:short-subunit dehydrogenase
VNQQVREQMNSFRDQTILITGAANGIGAELAILFDKLGCLKILLVDIDEVGLERVKSELKTASEILKLDLSNDFSNDLDLKRLINTNDIDVVVCNAGLGGLNPADSYSEEINRKITSVNFFGTTTLISMILPRMIERRDGHIVGVASLAGLRGMPQAASYSASKAAQISFLESLRLDLKPYGVRVTTILPGFIATKMTSHDDFKMPFMLSPKKTAQKIITAIGKNKKIYYFPFPMNLLALVNRFLPVCIYDFLIPLLNPPQKKDAKIF